jgi:hypothetical protein
MHVALQLLSCGCLTSYTMMHIENHRYVRDAHLLQFPV